ncbi:hypothetical protein DTO013E5_7861 [Penicillium roqueforti]|nr:hypothetical protein CBS147318_4624 [Penicillium roqueforti]KAI2726407.1 hypothetical protein CBS147332_3294 [Penicillium roqueforti]KAI2742024.1 hypothetical protein DTO012A1_4008 [Penicillium roqueforti]KAI2742362.1 hypothetical protein DTO013F2_8523 [Penicillium roqueforti]KAI2764996.1 hypothetical protein DTO006G1_296 [Penicillium roqueforti]
MGAIPEADPDEVLETKPFKFVTGKSTTPSRENRGLEPYGESMANLIVAGYDARFPQMNQTKHCWQNYVDYYKCTTAKGEDFRPCKQFYHSFRSLCPKAWTDRWDGQREAGNFPVHLDK